MYKKIPQTTFFGYFQKPRFFLAEAWVILRFSFTTVLIWIKKSTFFISTSIINLNSKKAFLIKFCGWNIETRGLQGGSNKSVWSSLQPKLSHELFSLLYSFSIHKISKLLLTNLLLQTVEKVQQVSKNNKKLDLNKRL